MGKGSCVISFTQQDASVCQNIYTTKTTTICTDYTCRKQARAFRFANTSAPMKYMGDFIFLKGLSIPAAISNQYFSLIVFLKGMCK